MKPVFLVSFLLMASVTFAQNDRVNDYNNTNWLQIFNTINLGKKWSAQAEYQWRREKGFKYWQQSLLRVGATYTLNSQVLLHAGYAWVETYPYGDYPIASAGTFPEHRIYEQLTLRQPVGKWTLAHRFRIEQRWLGRVTPGTDRDIESWSFLHRFRYQFRATYPIWKKHNRQLYGIAADEVFIGAGKNVGVNIFDQNRIFLMLGFKFHNGFSVEGGYFNQTLQQGRKVNNQTIMQRNNGFVLGTFLTL